MNKKIIDLYKRRQKAHDELLACDVELDKILKNQRKEIIDKIKEENFNGKSIHEIVDIIE